mmetsp:Transcript_2090/g.3854  ORF Transcript_2090/g.3854 Transcript_2090/m.3854 type:complete len:247 (-) Transcript_2090:380-1120(-)
MREIHWVDVGAREVQVDDKRRLVVLHDEGWLLRDVVPDVDDKVCVLNGHVHQVVVGQRCAPDIARVVLGHNALPHLRAHRHQPRLLHQHLHGVLCPLPIRSGGDADQGPLGRVDQRHRVVDGLRLHQGPAAAADGGARRAREDPARLLVDGQCGDVFGDLQVHGARLLLTGREDGVPNGGGDQIRVVHAFGHLRDLAEMPHDVQDLERALFGVPNGLLPRDTDHREAPEKSIGQCGGEVGGPWPEG